VVARSLDVTDGVPDGVTGVGVVGLGAMGSRIARRLLATGHDVTVWNRTAERAGELAAAGARVAASPADVARRSDVVVVMVADPAALRAVTEGDDGCVAGARAGSTLVDMSTVGPAAEGLLAAALPPGVGLVHAPVLGSRAEAESGALTVLAGGDPPLVRRVAPVLSALGTVVELESIEAAAAAKLLANAALFGVVALLGEVVALGEGLGLTRDRVFDVLATTPLAAQADRRREAIESGAYPARFALALAKKDTDLIQDAVRGAKLDVRSVGAVATWFADAAAAGWDDRDYTAVLAWIASRNTV
jgi:3-hydroxyisobutyrate dehydrogenase-like beta-hydroxyacid dehydrogenase